MLEPIWRLDGNWADVHVDAASGQIYGLRSVGWHTRAKRWTAEVVTVRLHEEPVIVRISGNAAPPNMLQPVRRHEDEDGIVVVVACRFRKTVHCFDRTGRLLWMKTFPHSVSGMCALTRDDGREAIAFATQGAGVFAFLPDGSELWHAAGDDYLFDCASLAGRDVVLSAPGRGLFVVDGSGQLRSRLPLKGRRIAATVGADRREAVVVAAGGELEVGAARLDGTSLWHRTDGTDGYAADAVACASEPLVAVSTKHGDILVYNCETGERLAATNFGYFPALAWLDGEDAADPLLLAVAPQGLTAFALRPQAPAEANAEPVD